MIPCFSDSENSILRRESPDLAAEFEGKAGEGMESRHFVLQHFVLFWYLSMKVKTDVADRKSVV